MIAYRQLSFILGILISILGVAMAIPAAVDIMYNSSEWETFVLSAILSTFVGSLMVFSNKGIEETLSKRDVFLLIPLSWCILPLIAAIPLYTSDLGLSFTDAYFETVSGVTTTGATILNNLDTLPPGLLLWRSLLQWMGGVGIVVMASGVLPITQVGGMQLLKLEFDPRMEKTLPRTAQLSLIVIVIYAFFTFLCALLYYMFGMGAFDAVNHAMTTMSTGGYSTHDASMEFFSNSNILVVSTIFMIIAALPFVLIFTLCKGGIKEVFQDVQARWFITILGIVIAMLTWNNVNRFDSFGENLRQTAFNVTSIMSGTGYVSDNYDKWGTVAVPVILLVMILGGGAGSTACGMKMFRLKILFETVFTGFKSLVYPNGVFVPYYGKAVIKPDVSVATVAYVAVFLLSVFVFTIIFASFGYDLTTAMSGAISALACVGPGMGDIIGPESTYAAVSNPFKWTFIVAMIIGRLEIFTVLILFTPSFWKE